VLLYYSSHFFSFFFSLSPLNRVRDKVYWLSFSLSTHYSFFQQIQMQTRSDFTCYISSCAFLFAVGVGVGVGLGGGESWWLLFLYCVTRVLHVYVLTIARYTKIELQNPCVTKPNRFSVLCSIEERNAALHLRHVELKWVRHRESQSWFISCFRNRSLYCVYIVQV
jgi:hypothetical protein